MITKADTQSFLADYTAFLGSVVRYTIASIRTNFLAFLLIVALAAAGSYYWWYRKVPYYESSMTCGYNNDRLARKNYGEMLQKLNLLAKSHSYRALASILHLPEGQTKTLLSLESTNMAGSALYEDITGNYQPFYLTVRATERPVFGTLEPALLNYLNANTYLNAIGDIEVRKINEKLALLTQDLVKVDSVISGYALFLRNTQATNDSVGGFSNIKALFVYKDELEDKMTSLQQRKSLQAGPSVMAMHGFAPPDQPTKGDKKGMWIGVLLGLVAATSWALFRNTVRNAS